MKDDTLSPLVWLTNLFIFALLLYIGKSAVGIDLVKECHADQVLLGSCKSEKFVNNINF